MVLPRTQCISIIDESVGNQARNNYNNNPEAGYPSSYSTSAQVIQHDWNRFRADYPNNGGNGREFWLLQPAGSIRTVSQLLRPANYISDSLTHTVAVNRDNGSIANRSDWYAICNLQSQPPGSYVSLWLDVSGSMTKNTVLASYNYFLQRCAAADINIVYEESDSGERWSQDQRVDFLPSASFSGDPNFLTNFNVDSIVSIPFNGSTTLSWIVFGDTTSANINGGVGAVSDPSGTITVSPTATTTYTLTAVGPVGSSSKTVQVQVLPPPPPTVVFSISPSSYISPGLATLSWTVSGSNITSIDINQGIGSVLPNTTFNASGVGTGSLQVSPTLSTNYTLTADNEGGISGATTSKSVGITVYQPTNAQFISVSPNPITVGQTSTLTWLVTGSAETASISPAVNSTGTVLLSSSAGVSPTTTTTYTLSASGPGGSDFDQAIVTVCQVPQISGNFPVNINYGDTISTEITYANAAGAAGVIGAFTGVNAVTTSVTYNFAPSASDESNAPSTITFTPNIPWDNFGPLTIQWTLFANGCGGSISPVVTPTTLVYIDQLPDAVNIPDSLDEIPSDDVEAPDFETAVSDPITITDIDIPVEIRANEPIQVRFDNADPDIESNWNNVREIID